MNTVLWSAFPIFISLLCSGCAAQNPSDSLKATRSFSELSQVSQKTLRAYPPLDYLYGIGRADSDRAAIEIARADLAKKIQVRVTTAATDLVREQGEQRDQLVGRLVMTRANEFMKGTQVAELGRDSESGLSKAVVVLSKRATDPVTQRAEGTNASTTAFVQSSVLTSPIWITAEGSVPFGPDTTLAEAAARSRDAARRHAVERAVGTFVQGQTLVYNTTVTANTVHSMVRGMILEEEILEEGLQPVDQQTKFIPMFYVTRLRVKVQAVPHKPHDGLSLTVELNRTVFQEGDEVQVAIVSSQDTYVYILNVGQDDQVTMVFPNKFAHDNYLSAQSEFVFPDENQKKLGIRLRTALPPGEGKSIEKVKVLATSKRLHNSKDQHMLGSLFGNIGKEEFYMTDLMTQLAHLEDTTWTETTIPYEIRR